MGSHFRLILACVAIFTLVLATPVSASSSVVHDASGDSLSSQTYTDIGLAKVTDQVGTGTLYFQQVLAGSIPAAPTGFTAYNWLIDTDGNGIANYVIVVRFCRHSLQAACVGDEWHWESALTNPATGQSIASFEFTIAGNVVKAFVAQSAIGSPSTFRWIAATRTSPASSGLPSVDLAPDLVGSSPVWAEFGR